MERMKEARRLIIEASARARARARAGADMGTRLMTTFGDLARMVEMRRRVTTDPEATRIAHEIAVATWRTMRTEDPISDEDSERMLDLMDEYEARAAILMGRQPQKRK